MEVDKKQTTFSGLDQSLQRLLVGFLAKEYGVPPDNSEVFFCVVVHIRFRFRNRLGHILFYVFVPSFS